MGVLNLLVLPLIVCRNQAAIKAQDASIELLGRQVNIDPNSGIFITMNPAGKGYGGRQKLPDNLKQVKSRLVFKIVPMLYSFSAQ